jgi:glucokinase
MKVLAGDIGGTKTLLHVAEVNGTRIETLYEARFPSQEYHDFASLLEAFLRQAPADLRNIAAACFGVAGPVSGPEQGPRTARITNLPWYMDEGRLAQRLQLPRVRLINDFFATAVGIEALGAEDLAELHPAETSPGAARLVVGAGTGLGVAQLIWCGERYHACPSEGGHLPFAPSGTLQMELLAYMQSDLPRVSNERLVSGPGLVHIYRFLSEREHGAGTDSQTVMAAADPAAAITERSRGGDPLAQAAVSLFLRIYGAVVGDLALITLAYGGIYVAGGIAPKLLEEIRAGAFMSACHDKGRMADLVKRMPVFVVLAQNVGLLGATLTASRL